MGKRMQGSTATRTLALASGRVRGRLPRTLGALLAMAIVVASASLTAAPALALTTHVFAAAIGNPGSAGGQLKGPTDTAVDAQSHDIFVADAGNFRVEEFDASGRFILAFGKKVDRTTGGDICTAESGDVCQAGVQGAGGGGQFSKPAFVAVDNSGGPSAGDIYVGDGETGLVSKFDASGHFLAGDDGSSTPNGPFGPLAGLAVDANGNVWVYGESGEMFELDQSGSSVQSWESGFGVAPAGIAVDAEHHLFIVRGNPLVEKLSASGEDLGQVTAEADNHATGIAADPAGADLYVEEEGRIVEHYSSCDPSEGPCTPSDSFGAEHLSGAQGLSVDPASGAVYVADAEDNQVRAFAGVPVSARVDSESALSPTDQSVTLQAAVAPLGNATTYRFEYGTTATYGHDVAVPAAGGSEGAPSATVSGLQSDTTYHYRVVAEDSQGATYGPDRTFTTEPAACPNAALRTGLSAALADCRAYELVTPSDKEGGEDMFTNATSDPGLPGEANNEERHYTTDVGYAADGGERFLLNTESAFGVNPTFGHNLDLFTRSSGGWSMTSSAPPGAPVAAVGTGVLDTELTKIGIEVFPKNSIAAAPEQLDMTGPPGGPYSTVVPAGHFGSTVSGASADLGHIIVQTRDHSLAPGAGGLVAGSRALYDWSNGHCNS